MPIKTVEQQAALILHRVRDLLVRQRTMTINALRGHLAEFGVIAPQGPRHVAQLVAVVRDEGRGRVPELARRVLLVLVEQLEELASADRLVCEHALAGLAPRQPGEPAAGDHPGHRADHRQCPGGDRRRPWRSSAAAASSRPGWAWCRARTRAAAKRGWAGSASAATAIFVAC